MLIIKRILSTLFIFDLLSDGKGPFNVGVHLRRVFGFVHSDEGEIIGYEPRVDPKVFDIYELFSCPRCLGTWIAAVLLLISTINKKAHDTIVDILSIAFLTDLLKAVIQRVFGE